MVSKITFCTNLAFDICIFLAKKLLDKELMVLNIPIIILYIKM